MLRVQSGQLKVLRDQLNDQRKASAAQAKVLGLQADELRESLKQREREAQERRRRQATKVTGWLDKQEEEGQTRWVGCIRNASDAPISEVRVVFSPSEWLGTPGGRIVQGIGVEALGTSAKADAAFPVIPPMTDRIVEMSPQVLQELGDTPVSDWNCTISFDFTDAAGVRWVRDDFGSLEELPPPPWLAADNPVRRRVEQIMEQTSAASPQAAADAPPSR